MSKLRLPVALTPEDRLSIGAEMSAAQTALEEVEAEKKAATKDFNESIKSRKATIHDRNAVLRSGVVFRDVEVETRPDPETGKRVTWRLDTGVPVRSVDLDPDERQVLLDLPAPGSVPAGDTADHADEQTAASPDEAEALRAERLAGERAERISAAVVEARGRITVLPFEKVGPDGAPFAGFAATLQFGDRVIEASADDEETARQGVVVQVTEALEALEDAAVTMDDAVAASKAEQDRQEVERLAAEQAKDEATTGKRGFKKGLVAPPRKKKSKSISAVDGDGNVLLAPVDDDAGEPPTPGDDGPVSVGSVDGYTPPEGAAF